MENIKISSGDLKIIADNLNELVSLNHISNITVINSTDLVMSFSNYRKERLLISLNHQSPFVSLFDNVDSVPTRLGKTNDNLRKEVKDSFITSVSTINNDRVLDIAYNYTDDCFNKEKRHLIIELIPHRPNLVIINNDNKIIFASHFTSLDNPHPILKDMEYEPIYNESKFIPGNIDLQKLKEQTNAYFIQAKHKRLEEQFKPLFVHIKSKIKSLNQKLKILDLEMNKAKEKLADKDIGDMLLAYSYDLESLHTYIKENSIIYDESLSAGVNANKYYKSYKKAKRTLEMDEQEIIKTRDEIANLETILAQSKYMNEDDIIELGQTLFSDKFKVGNKKKINSKPGLIVKKGVKIYFGKNAKQNDFLTFKLANKNDYFFHIKDRHGSHVIVQIDKVDNDLFLLASEIALLLSGQDVGDITYTQVKNIKKGSSLGQALLTSYNIITLTSVREETKKLLESI